MVGAAAAIVLVFAAQVQAQEIPGSYIVTLSWGDPEAAASAAERRYGANIKHVYRHALRGYSSVMSEGAARAIARRRNVASVVADRRVALEAQVLPTGVDRVDGDLSSTASGDGAGSVDVDVATLDTGLEATHPDLNVVGGVNCTRGPKRFDDDEGHGTHVAGIAAAKDDLEGVVGVAPGARLWAVKVLGGRAPDRLSDVICGVDWVTARASIIEVVNMSLSLPGSEPDDDGCATGDPFHDAVCTSVGAGLTYVVAAGNQSQDAVGRVPATFDEVITVSALVDLDGLAGGLALGDCGGADDTLAAFSNFGADVDLIAPGACILSSWVGGTYQVLSGTSMAAPHVAGAAALYKSTHPEAPPAQVRAALVQAGSFAWLTSSDTDGIVEPLLDAGAF